jgi:hypothetical protein
VILYGQLHLLFTCEIEIQKNVECTKNFAFLQMYRHLEDDPILLCPILTWDDDFSVENSRPYVVDETTSILKVL